ncbi:hypothetical protein CGCVW01_v013158 [Colletotrichum viniferum]|nr:hypothetical protein CGCVW01_v013158 [Colletotrichum viniferum]
MWTQRYRYGVCRSTAASLWLQQQTTPNPSWKARAERLWSVLEEGPGQDDSTFAPSNIPSQQAIANLQRQERDIAPPVQRTKSCCPCPTTRATSHPPMRPG